MSAKTHEQRSAAQEAQRYLENARSILSEKAGKRDGLYVNIRYVKMAARIAYSGTSKTLDEYLKQKEGALFVKRETFEDYFASLKKHDKRLLVLFVDLHARLYINGCLHGTRSMSAMRRGLGYATKMVDYVAS